MSIHFGKIITFTVTSAVVVLTSAADVLAVPVVPNFQQGQMTSHTETTSEVTEIINSMDYGTGYTYSVSGHGVKPNGNNILPDSVQQQSINAPASTTNSNGITSQWTGLNLNSGSRPQWQQTTPGANFSFVESYMGPGLQNHTVIERTTKVISVTDTTSIFTQ